MFIKVLKILFPAAVIRCCCELQGFFWCEDTDNGFERLQWWDLGGFGRGPADFLRLGSFFPDAFSFSKACTSWSHSASWIWPLTDIARIPMRLTMFARCWLMLWYRSNTWQYLYYLSSGSPCLIAPAKCFGMLMMYSPRTWWVLRYIPAGWPHLWRPLCGTQLAYGHVFISDTIPASPRLVAWDYTSDGFGTKCL